MAGCRCDDCRDVNTRYQRWYRTGDARTTDEQHDDAIDTLIELLMYR